MFCATIVKIIYSVMLLLFNKIVSANKLISVGQITNQITVPNHKSLWQ